MMMMENDYKPDTGRHFQFSPERKDNLDMLVLDLSRKKRVTLPEVRANQTIDSSHTLPVSAKKRQMNFLCEDACIQTKKTPVADSNAMLSPYTESDMKKVKTESMGYCGSNNQLKHIAALRNMHDITPGVTMVTPQQPSLPVFSNEATNIPIAIPMPYMESSQSFVTNNEARRKFSVLVECSTSTDVKSPTSSLDTTKKTPRPFKAYPNNFLSAVPTIDHNSNEEYAKFRQQVLEKVKRIHGTVSNPKMRRMSKSPGLPTSTVDEKDAAYWERRRKNNEAAKRSRDARRAKEDELAIRTTFLEHENARLKYELSIKEALLYNCNCNLPALPH